MNLKRAFSLIELMIVIVIIGLVYTLAVSKLSSVGEEKIEPSFLNLKEYLGSFLTEGGKSARLLCLDDCTECGVYVDGERVQKIESFFDASVEVYRYDFLLGAMRVKDAVYFNEENVQETLCFSFETHKSGVSEQLLVAYDKKVYDYTSYFEPTKVYGSLSELVEEKQVQAQRVMR